MKTARLRDICQALDISSARVEQWVSRGHIEPKKPTTPGKTREWTLPDTMRLAVLAELVDAGLDAAKVKHHVQLGFSGFNDDQAYLLISTGSLAELVPPTPRGGPGSRKGEGAKIFTPGELYSDIVKGRDLASELASDDRRVSIVINLDNTFARVQKAWSEIEGKAE